MIAKVVTEVALDREFDYLVPPELEPDLRIGSAVQVMFRNSRREGYVIDFSETSSYRRGELKPLTGLSTGRASIPPRLVELGRWMARYYCCSREQAIRTLLPAAVRSGKIRAKTRRLFFIPDTAAAEAFIAENNERKPAAIRVAVLRLLLSEGARPLESLRSIAGFTPSPLQTLIKHGLVAVNEEMVRRDTFGSAEVLPGRPLPPTPDQARALATISAMLENESSPGVLLLHGVTNSGKTEVYLQAIAEVLKRGKSAIVLVPEIALTPQTVRRFRARFGDELSVLHSRLSDGERFDEWNRINTGAVRIAVGARSALFAPFRNLGLIIVDEEHESSYKQSEAPRYVARDVAVMRGKLESAAVILGSATPSLESLYNVRTGRFRLERMAAQVEDKPAPAIHIIDQRLNPQEPGRSNLFSPPLVAAVQERVEAGEQVILFLNKRGYARMMICGNPDCGFEAGCPDCSVPYTYSRLRSTLSCHLCGRVIPAYETCPQCGSPEIRYSGSGTEKVENLARGVFGGARIARMDSDSMRSAEDYEEVLDRFRRGAIDILIGTQMIAKGLHFPNVTLVGIINADIGLSMPDFRAGERVFQLITQVAGRAGRGDRRGEVLIQTCKPLNETILHASRLDFDGFADDELGFRELMNYPPVSRLIALYFRGENEAEVVRYGEWFLKQLAPYIHDDVMLSALTAAPIERIKGKYRYLATLRGRKLRIIREALRVLILHRPRPKGVEVYADVDAQSLM